MNYGRYLISIYNETNYRYYNHSWKIKYSRQQRLNLVNEQFIVVVL